jgi:homogentisate 1,2-dioxygenase
MESNFLPDSPNVHVSPTQIAWTPFHLPSQGESVDFVDGLKTLAGTGEPSFKDGLAIHICGFSWLLIKSMQNSLSGPDLANKSMQNRAFCSNDVCAQLIACV